MVVWHKICIFVTRNQLNNMIMEKKFIQREETRYANNEFDNMPSIDYGTWCTNRLCAKNKNRIDFQLAKEICAKYGLNCTYINSTFGGDDADFIVYYKTNIDADYYQKLRDSAYGKDNNRDAALKFFDIKNGFKDVFINMHKCMHELDEQTNLVFKCGWSGNCGIFGSDDVRRISYGGGDYLMAWKTVLGCWDSCIYDTRYQLSKGVYIIANTKYIKPEKENSPELDEFENTLLDLVKKYLKSDYTAEFEVGKRQVDNDSYKALVVRYKNGEYCCMIRFSRDWLGRYNIWRARPLCGESSWVMDWKNPKSDIVDALGDCSIYAG